MTVLIAASYADLQLARLKGTEEDLRPTDLTSAHTGDILPSDVTCQQDISVATTSAASL